MKHRCLWLWPLSLVGLFAILHASDQTWGQGPDKTGPKGESEPLVIKDEFTGKEPRDRVRVQSPHIGYEHKFIKGKTYLIDLTSTDFDAYLRLEDPKGLHVAADDDSGGNLNAQISYQAEDTGTFRIIVTGYGRNTRGKFILTVREIPVRDAKPMVLKLSEEATIIKDKMTAEDGIDARNRHYKAYEFTANTTALYRVSLRDLPLAQARLENAAGQVLYRSVRKDDGTTTLAFRPKVDGTYRLVIGSEGVRQTGAFGLSITRTAPQKAKRTKLDLAKPVKLEAKLTAEDGTDRDGKYYRIYQVQAEANKEYRFEARGKVDPVLRLEAEDGKRLQEEDYGDAGYSRLAFRPTKPGTYHLIVAAGRPDQTGDFALTGGDRLSLAVDLTITKEPTKVSSQVTRTDELDSQARHHKTYTFKAEQGKIYRFEVVGDFAPLIGIQPVMGSGPKDFPPPIGKNPPELGGLEPDIVIPAQRRIYVPFKTGMHYLIVAAPPGQIGAYTLTGFMLDAKLAKPIPPDYREMTIKVANLSGTITEDDGINANGQPYQLIALKTQPKKLYDIKLSVNPGAPMPQFRLEGLKGEILRSAQFGPGNMQTMNVPSLTTAEYRLALVGALEKNISYKLTITESDYTSPKVEVEKLVVSAGKPISSTKQTTQEAVNASGQPYQFVTLKTQPKKLYIVKLTVNPATPAPQLRLEGLKGEFIRSAPFPIGNFLTLTYPETKAAEYRVVIAGFLDQNISHKLTITESDYIPAKAEKLIVAPGKSAMVMNQITEADPRGEINKYHKLYTFEAQQGKTYQIDLHSNAFDAYLYLKDQNNTTLMVNDDNGESLDSRIIFTMTKTGTYTIIATSLGGNGTGPYTLTVREVGAAPK